MDDDTEYFYRFRSINALLDGHQELEKQEIYFALPKEMNDPMEGFKDIYWSGDKIIWSNFIRHYLLCLFRQFSVVYIDGETFNSELMDGIIFSSSTNHPSDKFREIFETICSQFFAVTHARKIPELLGRCNHKIRREELKFYFRGLHGVALNCVINSMRVHKLLPPQNISPPPNESYKIGLANLIKVLDQAIIDYKDQERKSLNTLFWGAEQVNQQVGLIRYFDAIEARDKIWQTAIVEFPDQYVRKLENLLFYDWYAACFVRSPNQAAMWGHYGDGHRGVCLKFAGKSNNDLGSIIELKRIIGWGGSKEGIQKIYGQAIHPFQKMKYVQKFVEIDFFRSIGRIPILALNADWYLGDNGEMSACSDDIYSHEDEWRKAYYFRFESSIMSKMVDWEHENEYRLVLHSILGGFENTEDRKLVYNFSDLKGIIFGVNTSLEDKKRIVDIVKRKCSENGRTKFEFSQAYYAAESVEMRTVDLNLIDNQNPGG